MLGGWRNQLAGVGRRGCGVARGGAGAAGIAGSTAGLAHHAAQVFFALARQAGFVGLGFGGFQLALLLVFLGLALFFFDAFLLVFGAFFVFQPLLVFCGLVGQALAFGLGGQLRRRASCRLRPCVSWPVRWRCRRRPAAAACAPPVREAVAPGAPPGRGAWARRLCGTLAHSSALKTSGSLVRQFTAVVSASARPRCTSSASAAPGPVPPMGCGSSASCWRDRVRLAADMGA
jgi:hypothetical protein